MPRLKKDIEALCSFFPDEENILVSLESSIEDAKQFNRAETLSYLESLKGRLRKIKSKE